MSLKCGWVSQGHAPCEVFIVHQIVFVPIEFCGDRKTVTNMR